MQICLHFVIKDVSLFSGGGEGHSFGGRVILISLLSGGGSQFFFQGFLAEGHNSFKFFFIEKIYYEYPVAVGAGFRFLLTLSLTSKKMSKRQKQSNLYEFKRTIWHLEGGSNR